MRTSIAPAPVCSRARRTIEAAQVADIAVAPGQDGQRRIEQRRSVGIVEADDRNLAGHRHTAGTQLAEAAQREVGAGVDDRRDRVVELHERRRLGATRRLGPIARSDAGRIDGQAVAEHADLVASQALGAGCLALDPAHVADPPVPVHFGQVADEQLDPGLVGQGSPGPRRHPRRHCRRRRWAGGSAVRSHGSRSHHRRTNRR